MVMLAFAAFFFFYLNAAILIKEVPKKKKDLDKLQKHVRAFQVEKWVLHAVLCTSQATHKQSITSVMPGSHEQTSLLRPRGQGSAFSHLSSQLTCCL